MKGALVGVVGRLLGRRHAVTATPLTSYRRGAATAGVAWYGGGNSLEVVGESHYQDVLWRVVGGETTRRVHVAVQAVLMAETDNPYDQNAISVWIQGNKVGYLCRADAAAYRPGLLALQAKEGRPVALSGVVLGGGMYPDDIGRLGVWLFCDPRDFGVSTVGLPAPVELRQPMRTGLTAALATDEDDPSYDLSWIERLPSDPVAAIPRLRDLLRQVSDPIDRHYMFEELEKCQYRCRDTLASALEEYDETCRRHDAEMDGIRDALLAKFGKVPLLETYTQMAIRQQKAKDWRQALRWAERGVALYGEEAARPEAVDDLKKRIVAYNAKLRNEGQHGGRWSAPPAPPRRARPALHETLTCQTCGTEFRRPLTRGRKPKQCPECRSQLT